MLRVRAAKGLGPAFFGTLNRGMPVLGAIDLPGGFLVGRYVNGDIEPANEISERDLAFTAAAQAADKVSRYYSVRRNAASTVFYSNKAAQLESQIE